MTSDKDRHPNLYEGPDGCTVEVLGRTGLRYRQGSRSMFIDSEVLARPSALVVYTGTIARWDPPHDAEELRPDARSRILDDLLATLRARGIDVDLI